MVLRWFRTEEGSGQICPLLCLLALVVLLGCAACRGGVGQGGGDDDAGDDDSSSGDDDAAGDDDASGDDDSGDDDDSVSGEVSVVTVGKDFRCTPAGAPPFPGVLYNHGGLGSMVGGDLEGTCRALAEAGYLAYAKKRRETTPLTGHIDDVEDGMEALQALDDLDPSNMAILGFSRGGLWFAC